MDTSTSAVERFSDLIRPRRRDPERVTENSDYLAMLWRMIRALEARAIDDPEVLPQVIALAQRLAEVVNVAVTVNAERFAIDPMMGASMAECARVLGISKQSASERKARGREVIDARVEAAGAVRFSEARREREAIETAAQFAVTQLAEYRARHAQRAA
jgi:hypothetical protein